MTKFYYKAENAATKATKMFFDLNNIRDKIEFVKVDDGIEDVDLPIVSPSVLSGLPPWSGYDPERLVELADWIKWKEIED